MQYPSLPIYTCANENLASQSYYPSFQYMEIEQPMPIKYFYPPSYSKVGMGVINIIMLSISITLLVIEAFLIAANITTIFYLILHPSFLVIIVVLYFLLSSLGKIYVGTIGIIDSKVEISNETKSDTKIIIAEITGAVNLGLFIFFLIWSWSNFATGTNIILAIVNSLEGAISLILFLKYKNAKGYVMIPRY